MYQDLRCNCMGGVKGASGVQLLGETIPICTFVASHRRLKSQIDSSDVQTLSSNNVLSTV